MRAEPVLVSLETKKDEASPISHPGRGFINSIEGTVNREIANRLYPLFTGDGLVFNAMSPYRWLNAHASSSRLLVLFCAMESHDSPTGLHLDQISSDE